MHWYSKMKTSQLYDAQAIVDWVRFAWRPVKCHDGKTYWLQRLQHTYVRVSRYAEIKVAHPSKYGKHDIDCYWEVSSIKPL